MHYLLPEVTTGYFVALACPFLIPSFLKLFSSERPFYHISDNASLEQEILHGTRPTMSLDLKERATKRGLLPHIAALMKDCWDADPRLRPTAALLANSMRSHGHLASSPPFNAGERDNFR